MFCTKCGNEMYGTNDNFSNDKIVNDADEKLTTPKEK